MGESGHRQPPMNQQQLKRELDAHFPRGEQEQADRALMLMLMDRYDNLLTRENTAAHFTGSAWIVNRDRTNVLLVYHDMYRSWSWTGGHADGEADLLSVAVREAMEETGLETVIPVSTAILALDVLPVWSHMKQGRYVSSHLHLNAAYLLEADERSPIRMRPGENSGVKWVPLEEISRCCSEPDMIPVYSRLIKRMNQIRT